MNPNWKENYKPLSDIQIPDASEMTKKLLRLVENITAETLVDPRRKLIRIRTIRDKPAMQIRRYTQEIPEVRIHLRLRGDQNKAVEFFAAAGLRAEDWEKRPDQGSHKYIGNPEALLVCAERAIRSIAPD